MQFKKKKKSNLAEKERKKREKLAEGFVSPRTCDLSAVVSHTRMLSHSTLSSNGHSGFLSSADDYTPEKMEALRRTNTGIVLKPLPKSTNSTQVLDVLGLVTEPTDGLDDKDHDKMIVDEPLPEEDFAEPSKAEIQKIRAKRDRIRQYGSAAAPGADGVLDRDRDFVQLGKDDDEKDDSRLVRDSLFDDDEAEATVALGQDYNGGRISFGDPGKAYSTKLDSNVKIQTIDDDMDDDDEWRRWETQQILKSGVRRDTTEEQQRSKAPALASSGRGAPSLLTYKPTEIPSLDSILDVLERELSDVHTVNVQSKLQLSKSRGHIQELDESIDKMQTEYSQLSGSFQFFQELKKYILDLSDCAGEKLQTIEELEKAFLDGNLRRARLAWRRASQLQIDDKERAKELISGHAPPPDVVVGRMNRIADKQKVRSRLQQLNSLVSNADMDGFLSDEDDYSIFGASELQADLDLAFEEETTFANTCRDIYKQSIELFEDVYDDFSDIRIIAERFQEWKEKDPQTYNLIYVSDSLPTLFDPFVRLELLQNLWDPLFRSPLFDSMRWYRVTAAYGGGSMTDDDKDRNLVPNIIEKTILPRIWAYLGPLFDPISTRQNQRLLAAVEELLVYLEPTKLGDVISTIRGNLQGLVDRVDLLAIPIELVEKNYELFDYEKNQLLRALKLVSNCLLWAKVMPFKTIQAIVATIVDEKIVPHLRGLLQQSKAPSFCVDTISRLAEMLPSDAKLRDTFPVLHVFATTALARRVAETDANDTQFHAKFKDIISRA